MTFKYEESWNEWPGKFSLEPAMQAGKGVFVPSKGRAMFGAFSDSAPDTWGRRLMQRAASKRAEAEGRRLPTLIETDYLLGVADDWRLGAIRFKRESDKEFQAPRAEGVPPLIELPRLLSISEAVLRGEETAEELMLFFAPGSALGGARPKACVRDEIGKLWVAKFPKETDTRDISAWEEVALRIAYTSGITTPEHRTIEIGEKRVFMSKRFDRQDGIRLPFLSAMAMLEMSDGETGSYLDIVDALESHGAQFTVDAEELFRRVALNIMIANTDDHMRNHGFLYVGETGWTLSPVYDINPVPETEKQRIHATNIDFDSGNGSIELLLPTANFYKILDSRAKEIIQEVKAAVSDWKRIANEVGISRNEIDDMTSAFLV